MPPKKKVLVKKKIEDTIYSMQRGLLAPDHILLYQSYKKLYEMGQGIFPHIEEKLLNVDWDNSEYAAFTRYMVGFFHLAHDLNEQRSREILSEIETSGCPDHITVMLRSISSFSLDNYFRYDFNGINIFIHKRIPQSDYLYSFIEKMLKRVPKRDLQELTRIYIVRKSDMEIAQGLYTPILSTITLLWNSRDKSNTIFFRLYLRLIEFTLYHEIGHHKNKDINEPSHVQERRADQYAIKIYKKWYPYSSFIASFFKKAKFLKMRNYYRWGLSSYRNPKDDAKF